MGVGASRTGDRHVAMPEEDTVGGGAVYAGERGWRRLGPSDVGEKATEA